jgi:hypothetical protein
MNGVQLTLSVIWSRQTTRDDKSAGVLAGTAIHAAKFVVRPVRFPKEKRKDKDI